MVPVDRLQVHGFPDRPTFRVERSDRLKDLRRTALAGFIDKRSLRIGAFLQAHGLRLDQKTGQPVVRITVCGNRIHAYRQILQILPVPFVDRLFLRDMIFEMRQLSPDDPRNDIAHAVVVAELLMLIPGGIFPALRGPFAYLDSIFKTVRQDHAAAAAGHDLVAVERNDAVIAEHTGLHALVGRSEGFCSVFHDQGVVPVRNGADLFHFARCSVQVCQNDQLNIRIDRERMLQRLRRHVPAVLFRIDKDRFSAFVSNGIHGSVEGHIGTKYFFPLQYAPVDRHRSVQPLAGKTDHQMQRCSAAAQTDRILASDDRRAEFLHLVDILSDGAYPVGADRFVDPVLFFTVHGGRREPDFLFERLDPGKYRVIQKITFIHKSLAMGIAIVIHNILPYTEWK